MNVQVLSRPVAGFDGLDRHLLIGQQGGKVLAGGAANRENGGGFAAEKGHGAGDVDPAAAGFKYRRAAAEFPFRVDLRGLGGAIQRGGQRERINFGHSFSSLIRRLCFI